MSINKEFLQRDSNITAKIICDSISESGKRITTFELEYNRYIHCFDDKTEVLGRLGDSNPEFMLFEKAMSLNADIAQYDRHTKEISFVEPDKYIKNIGTHKMVTFEKNKLSLSVTDEHRVLVQKRTTGNKLVEEVWKAKDFLGEYKQCNMLTSGMYTGKQYFSKEELALMVWFASDGGVSGKRVNFHLRKQRKKDSVLELLNLLGIAYTVHQYKESFNIRMDAPSWVSDCYDEYGFKKLPEKSLYMDLESYEYVKKALLESDGCTANSEFNNTSKTYAQQVQILAHLHGECMNLKSYTPYGDVSENRSRLYKSCFKKENHISLRRDKDFFRETVYEGAVYCVSVPSKFILVRRNGIVHISGNCELLTHRMLSKNCSSSRAIPIEKMLGYIENNMAVPVYLGRNKSGMQAVEEIEDKDEALTVWKESFYQVEDSVNKLLDLKVHKQIANRLTEPYQMMKVVVTATEWDNFFNLRIDKDAQPELVLLADKMFNAMQGSTPKTLKAGQWHLPYVEIENDGYSNSHEYFLYDEDKSDSETNGYMYKTPLLLDDAIKISVASCAAVSYRTENMTLAKADKIFGMLINAETLHSSPFEHIAKPIIVCVEDCENVPHITGTWEDGVTHMKRGGDLCSGNFTGWIQYRHLLNNNTCNNFDYNNRMKSF